jgi:protein-S-isoprenylcysteine O-methyltransferase Ste14
MFSIYPDPYFLNPFGWVFLVILGIRYLVQFRISQKKDKTQEGEGGWHVFFITTFYLVILGGAVYLLFFQFYSTVDTLHGLILFIIGFSIYVFGALIRVLSLIRLGEFYSETIIIREDHKLIKSGIYSICRHPLHTGFLLELFGMVVFSQFFIWYIPWLLIPFAGFVWIIMIRTKEEEEILRDVFGPAYDQYIKEVPGLNIFWGVVKRLLHGAPKE